MSGGSRGNLRGSNLVRTAGLSLLCGVIPALLSAQKPRPAPNPNLPGRVPPAAQPAPSEPTRGAASPGTSASTLRGCPEQVAAWWRGTLGTGEHGRIVCGSDPTRPAILLVHGLHQDARTWTTPSSTELAYDYQQDPGNRRIGKTHNSGNKGIYEVGTSKWLYGSEKGRAEWDRANNWFDFLVARGFTVATWSQEKLRMSDAMPSSREAFDSFLVLTAARSPGAPPPVALIGHSRGGLVIRQLLKEMGSKSRVKWVITLHSPHQGSELGRNPGKLAGEIVDLIDCCAPPVVTAPLKLQLKTLAVEAVRPMTKSLMEDETRELSPGSPLIRNLETGEKKLDDVTYYTFGGTNPRVYRLYLWLFDAESEVPQYSTELGQHFIWRVKPVEITGVSPILDKIRDFAPEVAPGRGDALVSDASSRLPWSTHSTSELNHAELLWNQPLMSKVARLIDGPVAAKSVQSTAGTKAGK